MGEKDKSGKVCRRTEAMAVELLKTAGGIIQTLARISAHLSHHVAKCPITHVQIQNNRVVEADAGNPRGGLERFIPHNFSYLFRPRGDAPFNIFCFDGLAHSFLY